MDMLQYFDSEYKSLQENINATTNTLLETKQIVLDFAALEKELLYLILSFKFDSNNLDKSLEIVERLAGNARRMLASTTELQKNIQRSMTY